MVRKRRALLRCRGSSFTKMLCSSHLIAASECGFPGVPSNGSLVGSSMLFHPGEEASYLCHEGFVLFGDTKRTCSENGTWSGPMPHCSECIRAMASFPQVSEHRFGFSRTKSGPGKALPAVLDLVELRPRAGGGRRPGQLQLHSPVDGPEVVAGAPRRRRHHSVGGRHHLAGIVPALHHLCHRLDALIFYLFVDSTFSCSW